VHFGPFGYPLVVPVQPVQSVVPPIACVTAQNTTGHCMTINECHPTWKIFRTEAKDSWAFGLYNTCFQDGPAGREVNGVCCPDNKREKGDDKESLHENTENERIKRMVSQRITKRATACLLTNSQKQKIQNSQCIRRNVKRDSIEQSDGFIANNLNWPFVNVGLQNLNFRNRRAVDLGINRIIGGRPINPHQFKFVVSLEMVFLLC